MRRRGGRLDNPWAGMLWLAMVCAPAFAATTPIVYPSPPDHQSDGKVTGTLAGQSATFEYQHTYHPGSQGQKDFKANYVRFAADGPVDVDLSVNATITTAFLRTVGKDLPFTRTGSNFHFTLPGPGNYYLQLPNLNTPYATTYTVFFFFDDLSVYNAYQQAFAGAKDVTLHGVISHPSQDQTTAIQTLLNAAGVIYFPPGIYRTRQLTIPSNTTIYLAAGAVIKGTDNYNVDPTKAWFLRSYGTRNITIAGLGTIDANGFTAGNYNPDPNATIKCHLFNIEAAGYITLSDVLFRNSNSWSLHIMKSDEVTFSNIKVFSGKDGIDPDGSTDVRIDRAVIQSVDDGFAIKSRFSGYSCERVDMCDCIVFSCASSLKIGTENYEGKVKDITWDHCDAVDSDRGCIMYTNQGRGTAPISNIAWRNIRIFNFEWAVETGGAPFQFTNVLQASVTGLSLENIVAWPTQSCLRVGPVTATFRNVIVNGSSPFTTTTDGLTFAGVIWPSITSADIPVVFIEPAPRNQNSYASGDEAVVTVQHPTGKAIAQVELAVDDVWGRVDTSLPYRFPLIGLTPGEHTLKARATDVLGGTNTTAHQRIVFSLQGAPPVVVSNSLPNNHVIADNQTLYSVTLVGSDPDGLAEVVDMRIMLDDGIYATDHARGYLAWGATDADINFYGGQWTLMGNAAGGGRWGWRQDAWGSDTYITPASVSTSTSATQRTVIFTFKVKPAWTPAMFQRLRGFIRDSKGANSGWVLSPSLFQVHDAVPGDLDHDGDIDQDDFGRLQACLTGPGEPPTDPECTAARLDDDLDVDLDDVLIFQACMSGSNVPADPACVG